MPTAPCGTCAIERDPALAAADAAPELLGRLASAGRLSAAAGHCAASRRAVGSALYGVVWPIVFDRITRPLEQRRGHRACMRSVALLRPDCLDAFEDDVDAVIEHVLRYANSSIHNLEGWIASRAQRACVDGHRRRRGERGALQRPRLPEFLGSALNLDPWLCELALCILTWVGVPQTAGGGPWPLAEWAARRAQLKQQPDTGETAAVERDVARVLAAMRRSPAWYRSYVETPLGRKQAAPCPAGSEAERRPLPVVDRAEQDERAMHRFAERALERIQFRLSAGEAAGPAVSAVLGETFGDIAAAWDADRPPHEDPLLSERLGRLLADPAEVARITAAVLEILSVEG